MSRKLAEGRSFFMCSHGFPSSLCSLPLSVPGANIVKGKVKSEVMRKHREVFEDREKQRRRERATDGREGGWCCRGVLRVVMQKSISIVTTLSLSGCFYSFTLSLSLVVFTLLLSFHLSLALNHFSIFIISDTIWLFFLCVKYFDTIVVRLYYWFVICYLKCFVNFDLSLLNFLWARIVYRF